MGQNFSSNGIGQEEKWFDFENPMPEAYNDARSIKEVFHKGISASKEEFPDESLGKLIDFERVDSTGDYLLINSRSFAGSIGLKAISIAISIIQILVLIAFITEARSKPVYKFNDYGLVISRVFVAIYLAFYFGNAFRKGEKEAMSSGIIGFVASMIYNVLEIATSPLVFLLSAGLIIPAYLLSIIFCCCNDGAKSTCSKGLNFIKKNLLWSFKTLVQLIFVVIAVTAVCLSSKGQKTISDTMTQFAGVLIVVELDVQAANFINHGKITIVTDNIAEINKAKIESFRINPKDMLVYLIILVVTLGYLLY